MLNSFNKSAIVFALALCMYNFTTAQIRPYTQVFSQNLKGGTVIFGNTSMHIVDNSSANTTKMNESSNANNGQGGIGFSQYGNDNENMQSINNDAALVVQVLNVFGSASNWSYNNPNSDQGTSWRTLSAPPAVNWVNATGTFGYGSPPETVTIPTGKTTNYFLKTVNISNPALYSSFDFIYSYDDGAVVYVNGIEVKRSNMPAGSITYNTLASSNNFTTNESFSIPASSFVAGNNVIAVEVHQQNSNSNDCYFDMSLSATPLPYTGPTNSSAADLILPAGTNSIKFARLYWGGRIANSIITSATDTLRKVKIRKGVSGSYSSAFAPATSVDQFAVSSSETVYQTYIDIKPYIQANGAGTYTVADIPSSDGAVGSGGHYAGWCIIIAYENTTQPYNSVRIYDGFSQVFNAGSPVTQTVTLTGLNVPSNPLSLSDAVMSTMVWEGDANLAASSGNPAGDYVKINGISVSNAVNPITNFWNGSISKNGAFVTTKNPNYSNQMGIDIDELQVGTGYGILPNTTTVNIEFGTEADQYFPSVFGFAIKMKDPLITLDKTVADANNNTFVEINEILTYTLSGKNNGPGIAYNTFVVDSLPSTVNYMANSLKILKANSLVDSILLTDLAGDDVAFKGTNGSRNYVKFYIGNTASPTNGGEIPIGGTYNLQFKVRAIAPTEIINTARITTNSQAGDIFTDDGTANIGPSGGPLTVTLLSFKGIIYNNANYLTWVTENELINDYFDIEKSEDGLIFKKVGTVTGNGSTSTEHYYDFTDRTYSNAGVVYYRLRVVDFDGKTSFSKIILIRLKGTSDNNFSVFPNPFIDNIKITLVSNDEAAILCRIVSFDGKEILNRKVPVQKGNNVIVLKDLDNMAAGAYLLEINTGAEKLIQKIIKK